ncbi:hypothetical protein [Actinoplanes couchii]|uniref:PLL-like beta propeller domain-containing protein n=1 Tax=Actinoplanes couchii TaxID=403638 RepID=A0ABQ3XEV7_9ACTN|nr:hypothetical protein [Actinoplanes couchii]MDR6319898.1 hypothetical protein [Actinoplanes couchii]GID57034.1 hypothetical protein Aco03nite_054380 [Actinoplanes couchii]
MKRFIKLVAASAMAMAMAAVALPGSPANAAAAAAEATCHHATLGGTYICDYGVATATLADGRKQVFVVGPNHAVYSRWQLGGGTWNDAWYNMEGSVWSPVVVKHNNTNHILIEATGSNGYRYSRHRNGTTGAWGAWSLV